MTARIFQLNISPGGVPKLPLREVRVRTLGLEGDGHKHTKVHGGPTRAVSLYALEVIQALQAEGHPIWPGSAGENVTLSGLSWSSLASDARLALGDEVIVVLTKVAEPCKVIAGSFLDANIRRIDERKHPGWGRWYASVEREGTLRVGQLARLL